MLKTKMSHCWFDEDGGLRFDWDNDRHQRIVIKKGDTPQGVIETLQYAIEILSKEIKREKI
jgi:hypothetical protein